MGGHVHHRVHACFLRREATEEACREHGLAGVRVPGDHCVGLRSRCRRRRACERHSNRQADGKNEQSNPHGRFLSGRNHFDDTLRAHRTRSVRGVQIDDASINEEADLVLRMDAAAEADAPPVASTPACRACLVASRRPRTPGGRSVAAGIERADLVAQRMHWHAPSPSSCHERQQKSARRKLADCELRAAMPTCSATFERGVLFPARRGRRLAQVGYAEGGAVAGCSSTWPAPED